MGACVSVPVAADACVVAAGPAGGSHDHGAWRTLQVRAPSWSRPPSDHAGPVRYEFVDASTDFTAADEVSGGASGERAAGDAAARRRR